MICTSDLIYKVIMDHPWIKSQHISLSSQDTLQGYHGKHFPNKPVYQMSSTKFKLVLTIGFSKRFLYLNDGVRERKETYTHTCREERGEREREEKFLHPLVHSPSSHNGCSLARPKPGARVSTWVSHVAGRGSSSDAFPSVLLELDQKQSC